MQQHFIFLTMLLVSALGIQVPSEQTGAVIEGTVVDAHLDRPIGNASIVLAEINGSLNKFLTAYTDNAGKFLIKNIVTGQYRLLVQRNGYLSAEYGQSGPGHNAMTLVVRPGVNLRDILISMTPTSIIVGQVVDESGDPVSDSYVQVLRSRFDYGTRTLFAVAQGRTDDFGRYRLFGLSPGNYFLAVVPADPPRIENGRYITTRPATADGQPKTWTSSSLAAAAAAGRISPAALDKEIDVRVFYPGVIDEDKAVPIRLQPGEIFDAGTLGTRRQPVVRLNGRIRNGSTGGIMAGAAVSVDPVPLVGGGSPPLRSVLRSQGTFEFVGLMRGSYAVQASTSDNWSAIVPVRIEDKDISIDVLLQPRFIINGRIILDEIPTNGSVPDFTKLRVKLQSQVIPCGTSCSSAVDSRGRFSIPNLTAGKYWVELLGVGDNSYVKTIVVAGIPQVHSEVVLDGVASSFEIHVSPTASVIEGQIGEAIQGATVVLIPADTDRRRDYTLYRQTVSTDGGRFRLTGIAPGEYTVFAWEDFETGAWQDPKILQAFENRGVTVQVRGSQVSELMVPLIR